jgi:Spy/CpxP family protein refolding chaperone
MKNRWVAMILVLSLAMNTAVLAVAGYNYFGRSSRPAIAAGHSHDREHHFYKLLELSTTQLEKMKPLADSFHDRLNSLHSKMSAKKNAMITLLRGEGESPTRIEALRMEMAVIQDSIQKTVISHVLDVKQILDSSQRKRFFDLLSRSMTQYNGMFVEAGEK